MSRPYIPIDCEFHDVLEATATLRRRVAIRFRDDSMNPHVVEARIVDLFAIDAVEYMRLNDGSVIRLDRIISVDGEQRSAYETLVR